MSFVTDFTLTTIEMPAIRALDYHPIFRQQGDQLWRKMLTAICRLSHRS